MHLNELKPVPAVARRVWRLPRGTVSVHVRRTDHAKAIAHSPDELFVREMDAWCRGGRATSSGAPFTQFFLATDDPAVEEALRDRYAPYLVTYKKRTRSRNLPEGIEDAFVDLLLLARGSEIIGSFKSSYSSMAALYHLVPLRIVDRDTDAGNSGEAKTPAPRPYREFVVVARDP